MSFPRRSGIPKVMGILMIIFGSLGLLSALSNLGSSGFDQFQAGVDRPIAGLDELKHAESMVRLVGLIGLPISLLHLFAGIRAVQFKANAPGLSSLYAILAGLHTTVATIVSYVVMMPALDAMMSGLAGDDFGMGVMRSSMKLFLFAGIIIGLAWPILVGVLMTRPAARAACTT